MTKPSDKDIEKAQVIVGECGASDMGEVTQFLVEGVADALAAERESLPESVVLYLRESVMYRGTPLAEQAYAEMKTWMEGK